MKLRCLWMFSAALALFNVSGAVAQCPTSYDECSANFCGGVQYAPNCINRPTYGAPIVNTYSCVDCNGDGCSHDVYVTTMNGTCNILCPSGLTASGSCQWVTVSYGPDCEDCQYACS